MSRAMTLALFASLTPALLGTLLINPWARALESLRAKAGRPLPFHQVRRRLFWLLWLTCLLIGLWAYWLTSSGIVS